MRSLEELQLAFARLRAVDDCRNLMTRYISTSMIWSDIESM